METMIFKLEPEYLPEGPLEVSEHGGPHVVTRNEGETEWRPAPVTSYTWFDSVDPAQAIAELKTHMQDLRARRQKYAQEAELLWHWLAEKEDEYARLREERQQQHLVHGDEVSDLRFYVATLDLQHSRVWQAVGKMDWAIANTQKRIRQYEARFQRDENGGYVPWMPPRPETADTYEPRLALKGLRSQLRLTEQNLAGTDTFIWESIRQIEAGGSPPGLDLSPEEMGSLLADPNWRDVFWQLGEQRKMARQAEKRGLEALIRDGEGRVQKLLEDEKEDPR